MFFGKEETVFSNEAEGCEPSLRIFPVNVLADRSPGWVLTQFRLCPVISITLSFSSSRWLTETTRLCFVGFCYYCYFIRNNFRQRSENSWKFILCQHLIKSRDNGIMNMYVLLLSLLWGNDGFGSSDCIRFPTGAQAWIFCCSSTLTILPRSSLAVMGATQSRADSLLSLLWRGKTLPRSAHFPRSCAVEIFFHLFISQSSQSHAGHQAWCQFTKVSKVYFLPSRQVGR